MIAKAKPLECAHESKLEKNELVVIAVDSSSVSGPGKRANSLIKLSFCHKCF